MHILKKERENKLGLPDIRGSGSIAQISDFVIAIEDSGDDKRELWILKNRYTGGKGFAGNLIYNPNTGRLLAGTKRLTENTGEF